MNTAEENRAGAGRGARWTNPLGHAGYGIAAVSIIMMAATFHQSSLESRHHTAIIDVALEVLRDLGNVSRSLETAQAAHRGYMASGDERFIAERDQASASIAADVAAIAKITGDDADFVAAIPRLRELGAQYAMAMKQGAHAREARPLGPAMPADTARVEQALQRMSEQVEQLEQAELQSLKTRITEGEALHGGTSRIISSILFVCALLMIPGYIGFVRQGRARHRAEQRLRETTESMPSAVFQYRVRPNGGSKYEFLSGAVERMLGVDRARALRNPNLISSVIVEEDRAGFFAAMERGERDMAAIEHSFRIHDARGRLVWLRMSAAPRRDRDGCMVWTGDWSDVTEKLLMEGAVREKEAAEAASHAKSAFLATMSHEIRTPMNGIFGMLELLALTKLDHEQRSTLEVVRESSRSLMRIIDDILDFSKIEAGKLELVPEVASIAKVVEGLFGAYARNASSKGLLLRRFVDPDIGAAVVVDPVRLRQVLGNFTSNAIKFTAQGEVEIRAELLERRPGIEVVRFSVIDSGIGISAQDQRRMFEPFVQVGNSGAQRAGGTGLGLSICRRLAALMGGTVSIASESGGGTTISLTLPLQTADPAALKQAEVATPRTALARMLAQCRTAPGTAEAEAEGTLVLLVDDHPINRLVMIRQFNQLGYATEAAENGVEALEKWKGRRFGLVVTDCNMPEMDGYALARNIRAIEALRGEGHVPILACTANALAGESEKCFAAGMSDYVAKPVEMLELRKKLGQWLPIGDSSPIDASVLAEISTGDAQSERDILREFQRYSGEDSILLEQAVGQKDMLQVARLSHRIKGASRTIGASALARICETMEQAGQAKDARAIEASLDTFTAELKRLDAFVVSR